MNQPSLDGIAIIGLEGRFPDARDAREFWRNLVEGNDCITRFTDEQLAATGYDPKTLRALPGYVAARGVRGPKPEWFDRAFFNIPPKEAEVMDPQHRVFLESRLGGARGRRAAIRRAIPASSASSPG